MHFSEFAKASKPISIYFVFSFFFSVHMADIVATFATFLSFSPGYLFRLSSYPPKWDS